MESEDFFEDSQRMTRSMSAMSAVSATSAQSNTEEDNQTVMSQNLLARDHPSVPRTETISADEAVFDRALKRALEPLKYEVKRLKIQLEGVDKKQNTLLVQNEQLQKEVKELKTEMNKKTEELTVLLTGEGIVKLRSMCMRNLDMKANEEDETTLLNMFIKKAKEEGWLVKQNAKAEKDVISKFRDNRNYLKAQIRVRVHEDLTNQTPSTAAKLPKTIKFVREHLGVPELSNDFLLILYNFAYTTVKYNNKNKPEDTMTPEEKKIKKKAMVNLWVYTMTRVEADRKAKKEASSLRDRINRLLDSGVTFEAMK